MRLLNTETLQFEEFVGDIPMYAILSHTWGLGETSYQQFRSFCGSVADAQSLLQRRDDPVKMHQLLLAAGHDLPNVTDVSGLIKILKFCDLAQSNGYLWVWVDTCCINKESSAELSEAINSMFAWYRAAGVCWAYLADVVSPYDDAEDKGTSRESDDASESSTKLDSQSTNIPDATRRPGDAAENNKEVTTGRSSSETITNSDAVARTQSDSSNTSSLETDGQTSAKPLKNKKLRLSLISSSSFSSEFSFKVNEELAKFTAKSPNTEEAIASSTALDRTPDEPILAAQLSRSRWFRRCWTLQEMLAPPVVNFVDHNWQMLGDRSYFAEQISNVTGIEEWILHSSDCAKCLMMLSVAQKLQMASHREATRIEDVAYSLLGLFQINMTLIYGEGSNAFLRLQRKILKVSSDETIFAWDPALLTDHSSSRPNSISNNTSNVSMGDYLGLLAPHPRVFANAGKYTRLIMKSEPLSLTSQGVGFPILNRAIIEDHCPFASLPLNVAYSTRDSSQVVCVPLALDGGTWHRVVESDCIAGLQHLGTFSPQPALSAAYVRANTPRANLYVSASPSQFPRRYNSVRFSTLLKPSDDAFEVLSTVCALRFPSHRLNHEVLLNSTEPERAESLRQQQQQQTNKRSTVSGSGSGSGGGGGGGGGGGNGSGNGSTSGSGGFGGSFALSSSGTWPASSLVSRLTVSRRPSERKKRLSQRDG